MDPLTLGVFGLALLTLILLILAIRVTARPASVLDRGGTNEPSMRDSLLRIRTDELLALRCLSIVGVPLLMIVFSVALPALGNPLFLMAGALVGFLLPGFWLNGSRFGRMALVAGLILAAVCLVLVVILLQT